MQIFILTVDLCFFIWHMVAIMHLSIICPTTYTPPTWAMSGKRWGFELCKIQMHHLLGMSVSQIPTFSPPKTWDLRGLLLVNVHTSVHAYGEQANSPCIGQTLMSNRRQMPHLPPCIAREGWVVGHNIDRCIIMISSMVAMTTVVNIAGLFN